MGNKRILVIAIVIFAVFLLGYLVFFLFGRKAELGNNTEMIYETNTEQSELSEESPQGSEEVSENQVVMTAFYCETKDELIVDEVAKYYEAKTLSFEYGIATFETNLTMDELTTKSIQAPSELPPIYYDATNVIQ